MGKGQPWNGALAFDVSGHPAATHQDDHHDGVLWTGNDVLNGGSDDDTLNGGPGADNFAFKPGSGHDVIKDFEAGVDHIDLYGYAPSDVQLRAANGNEVIDLGGGNDITLEHVAPNQVAVNDLLFH